jgi:ribosomal protein L11 methyltransferase
VKTLLRYLTLICFQFFSCAATMNYFLLFLQLFMVCENVAFLRNFPLLMRNKIFIQKQERFHFRVNVRRETDASNPKPSFQELSFQFNCTDMDPNEITDVVYELGATGVMVEIEKERSEMVEDRVWSDLQRLRAWETASLKADLPQSLNTTEFLSSLFSLYPQNLFHNFSINESPDKDWTIEYQMMWQPVSIGNLTISFPWNSNVNITKSKYSLLLQGGAAFGTGDHPTTRLSCKWLEKEITAKNNLSGLKVLDYGCGSGILGLAVLKFGASEVDGVDIDEDSLFAAETNAELNNVTASTNFYLTVETTQDPRLDDYCRHFIEQSSQLYNSTPGFNLSDYYFSTAETETEPRPTSRFPSVDILQQTKIEYDFVVANIYAPVLISLAPQLAAYTKKNSGQLGMSGLLRVQADRVMETYRKYFQEVQIEDQEDDWVIITCKNKRG